MSQTESTCSRKPELSTIKSSHHFILKTTNKQTNKQTTTTTTTTNNNNQQQQQKQQKQQQPNNNHNKINGVSNLSRPYLFASNLGSHVRLSQFYISFASLLHGDMLLFY